VNSLPLTFACGFKGVARGTTLSPNLKANLSRTARVTFSGAGKVVYDNPGTVTIAGAATLTLDLTTGLYTPLNEHIDGANDFDKVFGLKIEHDSDSLSTTGITAFGGASDEFQGPWAAGDKVTLLPGAWTAFGWNASKAGWTVDATHKKIAITNLHATLAATVKVFILGTV
jgi:hypothetical protein